MVTIELYNFTGEHNQVNKELGEPLMILTGYLYGKTLITLPMVQIQMVDAKFNYVYIQNLERFYFVDKVEINNSNVMELSLSVDVLNTYKDAIMDATATLFMGEQVNFLNTTQPVYDIRDIMEIIEFDDKLNKDGEIIMVTIKGQRE